MLSKRPTLPDDINVFEARFSFSVTAPDFVMPKGACDCHVHVFGPIERYPYAKDRAYTPMDALPSDGESVLNQIGFERAVLIQPSVYGSDNRCLLNAIDELSVQSRGIVVVKPETDRQTINNLHKVGIRGIRLNGIHWTAEDLRSVFLTHKPVIREIAEFGWHVEVNVGSQAYPAVFEFARLSMVDIVLDHLGGVFRAQETSIQRLESYSALKDFKNVWVKLSGPHRIWNGTEKPDWHKQLVLFLAKEMPDRVLWASDWPYTPDHRSRGVGIPTPQSFQNIDAGVLISEFSDLIADSGTVKRILVDNPAALYDFNDV